MTILSLDYTNNQSIGTRVCTKVVCILLTSSMFAASVANAQKTSKSGSLNTIESVPAPKVDVSLMLHSLINSLKTVLDEIEETQYWGASEGSLDSEACSLANQYNINGVDDNLSQAQILAGLDDCDQINTILNDPTSEYDLSPNIEFTLKNVVNSISWELENGQ
jgi:hypothetical protein